jgi:uncharacterized membrane protein YphA (DoxX/SURF4 family)
MNTTIWIIQGILAAFFLMPAFMKLTLSKKKLISKKQLQPGNSPIPVRILGLMELLGAIGIIIPLYTNTIPLLTPLAAVGFCIVMIGAFFVHFKRKEYKVFPVLVIAFIAALIVAIYRF